MSVIGSPVRADKIFSTFTGFRWLLRIFYGIILLEVEPRRSGERRGFFI